MKRDVKAVMQALDQEHDSLEDAAKAAIEAYESVAATRDQWIVVARPLAGGPYVSVGPWTTHNQASKASRHLVSAHNQPAEGTGMAVMKMYQPDWVKKLDQ
jgi:hypothetical protein